MRGTARALLAAASNLLSNPTSKPLQDNLKVAIANCQKELQSVDQTHGIILNDAEIEKLEDALTQFPDVYIKERKPISGTNRTNVIICYRKAAHLIYLGGLLDFDVDHAADSEEPELLQES
jgi:hypothetical protein